MLTFFTFTPGWLSLVPPVVSIAIALATKQVYFALGLFVWLGVWILHGGDPWVATVGSVDLVVDVLTNADNVRILLASTLIGAVVALAQSYGGGAGLAAWFDRRNLAGSSRMAQLVAAGVSMCIFLESNFGLLVAGSVARPLCDRAKVSRERLSYILDATCAPKQLMIPINAWGAYIVGILTAQGVDQPNALLWSSLPYNFYSLTALVLVFVVIVWDVNIGPMRAAQERVRTTGQLLREGAKPLVSADFASISPAADVPARARQLLVPIGAMTCTVPLVLWWTGNGSIMAGDGGQAVLWGVLVGVAVAMINLRWQKLATFEQALDVVLKGVSAMVPMVLILALAFAISATQKSLGTGVYLAQLAQSAMPTFLLPSLVFGIACFVAFSTGTSWGTFAVMIPIVLPMVDALDLAPPLMLAAALSGGIFGDHCSPISDSTLVASMASGSDHIDHVRTQLPYALVAAAIALVLYLIAGWLLY